MKKKLLAFLLIAMGVGVVNVASPKVASAAYTPSNWRHVKTAGENPYTFVDEDIRSSASNIYHSTINSEPYRPRWLLSSGAFLYWQVSLCGNSTKSGKRKRCLLAPLQ